MEWIGFSGLAEGSQNQKEILVVSRFILHLLLNLTQILSVAIVFKIFCSNKLYLLCLKLSELSVVGKEALSHVGSPSFLLSPALRPVHGVGASGEEFQWTVGVSPAANEEAGSTDIKIIALPYSNF